MTTITVWMKYYDTDDNVTEAAVEHQETVEEWDRVGDTIDRLRSVYGLTEKTVYSWESDLIIDEAGRYRVAMTVEHGTLLPVGLFVSSVQAG